MTTNEQATVFVIDDDRTCRDAVSKLLAPVDVQTKTLSSAEELLHNYQSPTTGCVICELRLPGMGGLELLTQLTQREIHLPVVILTQYADVPSTAEAFSRGVFTLLEKPFREQILWDAIRDALALSREMNASQRRRHEIQGLLNDLSDKEREVMGMIVEGRTNKSIAIRLNLSLRTIESRRKQVFRKTCTTSVAQLVSLVREYEQPICRCRPARTSWRNEARTQYVHATSPALGETG